MLAMTLMDKLSMGGMVALLGIGAVFFILLLLILSIKLVSKIIGSAKPVEVKQKEVTVQPVIAVPVEDDAEIAAAITAAIYAILASEQVAGVQAEFKIRKIRQIYR